MLTAASSSRGFKEISCVTIAFDIESALEPIVRNRFLIIVSFYLLKAIKKKDLLNG
jgi:hypothetical protein